MNMVNTNSEVTDQKILELWRSPLFSASYRGIRTFKRMLKLDLNIDISEARLYAILKNDPVYLIHQKPARNFKRRQDCQIENKQFLNQSKFIITC